MKKQLIRYGLMFLLLVVFTKSYSQTDTTLYKIETMDDNEYMGTIVEQDQTKVVLKTKQLGLITIQKIDIKEMIVVQPEKIVSGKYWFDNPQASRYFWQPTGYGLKKGEGYYQNIWVLFNQFSVGVTDHFSVGAGLVPLFMFGGAPTPVWVTPKFSLPSKNEKFSLGVGVLAGSVLGVEHYYYDYTTGISDTRKTNENFGITYAIATFGSRDRNVSLGLGYGYSKGKWGSNPSVSFSVLQRISDKGYFVSENYIINNVGLLSLGGRRIINKVSLDFGALIPVGGGIDRLVTLPWLGLVVPFQKKSNQL